MAKKDAAKRAAKKHEKEKKRQRKLAARPPATGPKDPVDLWRPATEGIEGLARRMNVGSHDAAKLAELIAKNGRRADAREVWHPSRVRALSTEAIVAALAERGIETDEAAFTALVGAHESARRLARDAWAPLMRPDATVHDRDFVGEAAVVLWERWAPDALRDEELHEHLRSAAGQLEEGEPDAALDTFCTVWERVRDAGGLARLARSGGFGEDYARELFALLSEEDMEVGADDELEEPDAALFRRRLAVVHEVRAGLPAGDPLEPTAALAESRLLRLLGRPEEAVDLLLAAAPAWPDEPDLLGQAALTYATWRTARVEVGQRIRVAVLAARDAAGDPALAEFLDFQVGLLEKAPVPVTAG